MISFAERVRQLEEPVEVDSLRRVLDAAVSAAEDERDALGRLAADLPRDLREASADARERSTKVGRIDRETSTGVLGTLLSSADEGEVVRTRERAANSLSGSLAVLEARIEDARAWADRRRTLVSDADRGAEVLRGLRDRAERGGLDGSIVRQIDRAASQVAQVPAALGSLDGALDGPIAAAEGVAEETAGVLGSLRTSQRAATVGEALIDRVIPSWVPGRERETVNPNDVQAQIEYERASARTRARADAEDRRAAMAELDALDDT
jgi:hypothetical protein